MSLKQKKKKKRNQRLQPHLNSKEVADVESEYYNYWAETVSLSVGNFFVCVNYIN